MRACPSGELAWQRPVDEAGCANTTLNRLSCAGMGLSCCNPLVRKGNNGSLVIVLRCNRLHRFVKSRNSVVVVALVCHALVVVAIQPGSFCAGFLCFHHHLLPSQLVLPLCFILCFVIADDGVVHTDWTVVLGRTSWHTAAHWRWSTPSTTGCWH